VIQVGVIDHYGTRTADVKFEECLPFRINDTIKFLTDSISYVNTKRQIVDCILNQPSIKQADISFVCCYEEGKWMAFIGTSDKPKADFNSNSKTKDVRLPAEFTESYDSLMNLIVEAIQNGQATEDDSEGHALFDYPPCRKIQERFKVYAAHHLGLLRDVIQHSKYPHEREAAVTIIAYYHDKKDIVKDLEIGANDDHEGVRNDAVRALGIILNYAQRRSDIRISISPDPFIQLMQSISWTDRNKSSRVLLTMSDQRDPKLLKQLKETILQPLVDMAVWQSYGHAMPGYVMLGRIAGWTDQEIHESAKRDRREMVAKMISQIK
jgi:hypothetical protein